MIKFFYIILIFFTLFTNANVVAAGGTNKENTEKQKPKDNSQIFSDRRINLYGGFMDRVKIKTTWKNDDDRIDPQVMDYFLGFEIDSNLLRNRSTGNKIADKILKGFRLKSGYQFIKTGDYYAESKSMVYISLHHRVLNSIIKIEPGILYKYEITETLIDREVLMDRIDIFIPIYKIFELGLRFDNKILQSHHPSSISFLLSFAFSE